MLRDELRFDEEQHRYFFRDKELRGVTSLIAKRLRKKYSESSLSLMEARDYGKLFHKEVEDFIMFGLEPKDPGVRWVNEIVKMYPRNEWAVRSEMLISNYKCTASAIDLVLYKPRGDGVNSAVIFDIKTGEFCREYCSWQLGFYKWFLEIEGDFVVEDAFVIAKKDARLYRISPIAMDRCQSLLEVN
jgi:hypothetical protein